MPVLILFIVFTITPRCTGCLFFVCFFLTAYKHQVILASIITTICITSPTLIPSNIFILWRITLVRYHLTSVFVLVSRQSLSLYLSLSLSLSPSLSLSLSLYLVALCNYSFIEHPLLPFTVHCMFQFVGGGSISNVIRTCDPTPFPCNYLEIKYV